MTRSILHISKSTILDENSLHREFFSINSNSNRNNKRDNITGVLAYYDDHYMQVIEGDSNDIECLVERIKKDHRNEDFHIVLDKTLNEKIYEDWNFVLTNSTQETEKFGNFLRTNVDSLIDLEYSELDVLDCFVEAIFY